MEWVTLEDQLKQLGGAIDREQVNRIMFVISAIYLCVIAMYVTFGFLVSRYPTPITITGLVVSIGINLALAAVEPANLAKGLIIKVIVIVGLAKAIQVAIAYERERKISDRGKNFEDDDDSDRRRRDEVDDDRHGEARQRMEDEERGEGRWRRSDDGVDSHHAGNRRDAMIGETVERFQPTTIIV